MGRMCSQLSLCNKVKIPSKKEHWGFKYLIESTPMIGYKYIRSRLSIEINTILESLKKKKKFPTEQSTRGSKNMFRKFLRK